MTWLPDKNQQTPLHGNTLVILATLISATTIIAIYYFYWGWQEDDVFISLRYARNLLEGNGLVWNKGEHVEGYTNFLFTLMISGLGWMGVDLLNAAIALSIAGLLITLAALSQAHRIIPPLSEEPRKLERYIRYSPLFIACCSPPLIVWSLGALETTLFTAFTTIGVLVFLKYVSSPSSNKWLTACSLSFAAATLTRPEGGLFMAFTGLFLLIWLIKTQNLRTAIKQCVILSAPYLFIIGSYALWKLHYYGDVIPNTWYAKSYGVPYEVKLTNGFNHFFFFFLRFFLLSTR